MTERYDAIVIGAGHNGLVCAALLARAGKRVLVLEANDQVGGAAITREFAEDFLVSACAHLLYQLQPKVVRELHLKPELAVDDLATIALAENGAHVRILGDTVSGVSDTDQEQYRRFRKRITRFADLLRRHMNRPPPRLGSGKVRDAMSLAWLGLDLRRLGRIEMREFLRLVGMNIHDELEERFESAPLKGAIALDAVLGTHLGPRSPNTFMTYLYRLAGSHGRLAMPAGGMGGLCEQLAHAARSAGATIRTRMPVKRIVVRTGRVVGVETESGEQFESLTVISNADPKTTVMTLLGARHVETGFVSRVRNVRARGIAAKLHLALDCAPSIDGVDESQLDARFVIAPDADYVERAFNPAKYGEYSKQPVIEFTLPSIGDPTLAPNGKHVLSAVAQYAPYELDGGWDDDSRNGFLAAVLRVLERYMPNLVSHIVASELLLPTDIEREFHIAGGHWHHAELTLDQFLFVRPVPGAAQYALPIDGLYLCGAGAHPGGNVSGAAGRNAARAILKREKVH